MFAPPASAHRELLRILQPFWKVLAGSIVLGAVGGVAVTALLTSINRILNAEGGVGGGMLAAFAGLCAVALASSILSNLGTNYVGQKVIAHLRQSLGAKVLCAPIEQLERYRTHRLIPVLTHDIDTVSDLAFGLPQLVIASTVTLGCLGYLASLSLGMFGVTAAAVVLGSAIQYLARGRAIVGFEAAREGEDRLQQYYRSLAEGAKELRMHRPRRQRLFREQLSTTVERICGLQIRSANVFLTANTLGSLLFFIVIAVALALQGWWAHGDRAVLSGFVMTLLFMKGPLESVLSLLPLISRNRIALRRIADLSARFSTPEANLLDPAPAVDRPAPRQLELRDVRYAYPAAGEAQPFVLGPLNLTLEAGQILFIVGPNGGGKTSLIKLLLGLYAPHDGQILLDGRPVTANSRDDYRQLFTTVFADFFLFDDLLGDNVDVPAAAAGYLKRLEIDHKVEVKDGNFSTTDLSTGQRKRLALVHAWLDQRPILVFDEWAADQDPAFRHLFYTELLPDLKRQGKTLIVISHDDRYFHIADRRVRMEHGRLIDEQAVASSPEAVPSPT
ncbi:cyclic peptide export ABC transporter [Pseudomonas sp. RIT-PI-S]|uniref:cyclic peptide export ABC transporter n=1 Tax=Pseudomonas sp. RIT-PI-S TaxID=3035295 RepID=UPI0021D92C5B|nr:cyclic peptide export ABC transporter [Pseudomonas sp. RIT-PI-S]